MESELLARLPRRWQRRLPSLRTAFVQYNALINIDAICGRHFRDRRVMRALGIPWTLLGRNVCINYGAKVAASIAD